MRGAPRGRRGRGLLAHLDARAPPGPSPLVRVRRSRQTGRPPLLLPQEIQAILDGCAVFVVSTGEWRGSLRDRLLFALLAETGMRIGELLGLRIGDVVMGRGGTAYVEIVPREDNTNGARVKMMRPRRVYIGADVERLFADYLTHLASRAADLGFPVTSDSPLLVNLERPPLLAALREGTVRDKTAARPRFCSRASRSGSSRGAWGTHTCKPLWISTAGSAKTKCCAPPRTGRPTRPAGRSAMRTEPPGHLWPADGLDPIWQLWNELPLPWRGPMIGPGIEDWESITENGDHRINLTGLPEPFGAELAWMAHWQAADGTRSSVLATNQLANILRMALREDHPIPASIREMDWAAASALQGWFYAHRWGRLPPMPAAEPGCGSCSDSRASHCSRAATTAPGGRWTTGTHAATRGSRSPDESPWPTTGAHPARSPSRGSGTPSNGISARCWRRAPCAGRPSARNDSGPWSASIDGSRTRSMTPTTSSAIQRLQPDKRSRSAPGTQTEPTACSGCVTAGAEDPCIPA